MAVLAVLSGGAWVAAQRLEVPSMVAVERCSATSNGVEHSLAPDQSANAALIAAVARRRGLPARAVTIALATAVQESKLRNIDYGDRDSLGLFQQRPSQGWGTPEQVTDPLYATEAFYDGLVEVEGYESLPVTDAAQRVQRSGFPLAYGDHEDEARAFASALTGYSPAALTCRLRPVGDDAPQEVGADGLSPRAAAVRDRLVSQVGEVATTAGADGRVLLVGAPGGGEEAVRRAWVHAHWAVANAADLGVTEVAAVGRVWRRSRRDAGWQLYADDAAAGSPLAAPEPGVAAVRVAG